MWRLGPWLHCRLTKQPCASYSTFHPAVSLEKLSSPAGGEDRVRKVDVRTLTYLKLSLSVRTCYILQAPTQGTEQFPITGDVRPGLQGCAGGARRQARSRCQLHHFLTFPTYQHIPEATPASSAGGSHRLARGRPRGKGASSACRALGFQGPTPETSCGHQTIQILSLTINPHSRQPSPRV